MIKTKWSFAFITGIALGSAGLFGCWGEGLFAARSAEAAIEAQEAAEAAGEAASQAARAEALAGGASEEEAIRLGAQAEVRTAPTEFSSDLVTSDGTLQDIVGPFYRLPTEAQEAIWQEVYARDGIHAVSRLQTAALVGGGAAVTAGTAGAVGGYVVAKKSHDTQIQACRGAMDAWSRALATPGSDIKTAEQAANKACGQQ